MGEFGECDACDGTGESSRSPALLAVEEAARLIESAKPIYDFGRFRIIENPLLPTNTMMVSSDIYECCRKLR